MSADLVAFLRERVTEDRQWALAASSIGHAPPDGGEHWQWVDTETDQPITPDPLVDEKISGEDYADVSLRSVEQYSSDVSDWTLPTFAIHSADSDSVPAAVAGHIARWDPARVLAECDAKEAVLEWCTEVIGDMPIAVPVAFGELSGVPPERSLAVTMAVDVMQYLAVPYSGHPDYREEWKPVMSDAIEFSPAVVVDDDTLLMCESCGADVQGNQDSVRIHREWHKRLDAIEARQRYHQQHDEDCAGEISTRTARMLRAPCDCWLSREPS